MKRAPQFLMAVVFLLTVSLVGQAQAGVIKEWDYTVSGGFVSWNNLSTVGNQSLTTYYDENGILVTRNEGTGESSPGYTVGSRTHNTKVADGAETVLSYNLYDQFGNVAGTKNQKAATKLQWSDTTAQKRTSSIGIDAKSGTLSLGDENEWTENVGADLWHDNQTINLNTNTMVTGTALMTLSLVADVFPAVITTGVMIDFWFLETDNAKYPAGDLFIVTEAALQTAVGSFTVDDVTYTFSFKNSFTALDGTALDLAIERMGDAYDGGNLYGWVTPEGRKTLVPTAVGMTYEVAPTPTPEPGTILLMGAGLLGMLVVRKRFKQ